jgi:hypothetical protein
MNRLLCVLFLQLVAGSTLGQSMPHGGPDDLRKPVATMVQRLYRQVISRHPLGIPSGDNWKIFEPYLSKGLRYRIEMARSCADDWLRQNQRRKLRNQVPEKAPIAWSELGFFSGDEELSEPSSFQIERIESNQDGSFRVHVKLTESTPNEKPWSWEVAVQVVMENKRRVIDDVSYLKGQEVHTENRLSEVLKDGCDGPHWVGNTKHVTSDTTHSNIDDLQRRW